MIKKDNSCQKNNVEIIADLIDKNPEEGKIIAKGIFIFFFGLGITLAALSIWYVINELSK